MATPDSLALQAVNAVESLSVLAHDSVLFKMSIAYIMDDVNRFAQAVKPMRQKEMPKREVRVLQKFLGVSSQFKTVLQHLNKKAASVALNWPSTYVHNCIESFRRSLIDVCRQLHCNTDEIVLYDKAQDAIDKKADLRHLRDFIFRLRENANDSVNIDVIKQLVEVRLRSIDNHLPEEDGDSQTETCTSREAVPDELKGVIDRELSEFTELDIPSDDLRIVGTLGRGGFGTVLKAVRLSTGELLAVKEVHSKVLSMSTWSVLRSEIATMAPLRHPHVLELVGIHIREPYRIITRFCRGISLFDRLHRTRNVMSVEKRAVIAYQVAKGMQFLHANGIVHRDLKTMNILLDDQDVAKIADFGLAGIIHDDVKDLIGGVGTPHYAAPEVLGKKRYGMKVDIYSYGVVLWELATGEIPWKNKTHKEIYDTVTKGNRLQFTKGIPTSLRNLIMSCWLEHPDDRPLFPEIVSLFEDGKIVFPDMESATKLMLDQSFRCPPISMSYVVSVLRDPSLPAFRKVAKFITYNMDDALRSRLQEVKLLPMYKLGCDNVCRVLILTAELLNESQFQGFLTAKGLRMIEMAISDSGSAAVKDVVRFCLRVPDNLFHMLSDVVSAVVKYISEPKVGLSIIQLLARVGGEAKPVYNTKLIEFFSNSSLWKVMSSQEEVDAVARLLPMVADDVPENIWPEFVCIFSLGVTLPTTFIDLLSSRIRGHVVEFAMAVMNACTMTDLTLFLCKIVLQGDSGDLEELANRDDVFEIMQQTLDKKKCVHAILLLVFRVLQLPSVILGLKSVRDSLLLTILQVEGYVAQKLQIFTCSFTSATFEPSVDVAKCVVKLLVYARTVDGLIGLSVKLVCAMSSQQAGIRIIVDFDLLLLFAQLFWTANRSDLITSLEILSNAARAGIEIPRLSLTVSCLMQALVSEGSEKCMIMRTLCDLVTVSVDCIQENDIQNMILPMLARTRDPAVLTMIFELLQKCDISKFANFDYRLLRHIYGILTDDEMMYPELIAVVSQLVTAMAVEFDMNLFIRETKIKEFLCQVRDSIEESTLRNTLSDSIQRLHNIT